MMVYESLYPPPPSLDLLFGSGAFNVCDLYTSPHPHPERKDYTLYVESDTGRRITYEEHWQRVGEARAGLVEFMGLDDRMKQPNREMVGILGENCIVSGPQ
jgi:hypothetical protein